MADAGQASIEWLNLQAHTVALHSEVGMKTDVNKTLKALNRAASHI